MAKAASRKKSKYLPHPGFAKEDAAKEKFAAQTGKPFDHWVALARKKGGGAKEMRAWLREEHGLGSMNSWWVASVASSDGVSEYEEPEKLVDALYSGSHAALRPVHEKVVDAAIACGDDVIPTSCKTMVPIYRKHVFAEMRPVDGCVELQLALGDDVPAKGRLLASDGRQPGDRLTHRVRLTKESEVDAELRGWMQRAYENGLGKMARAATAKTPADLAAPLAKSAKAKATWDACTDAMRRDWILWIDSAKQEATRTKRIAQTLEKLAAGKKRMY
jgi:hypothetical protein